MKVIFLDIDGVLNSLRSAHAFNGYPHDFSKESLKQFDWVAIELIKRVCDETNAKIVISSTWRKQHSIEDFKNYLKLDIIDKTPTMMGGRGYEIQKWLADKENIEKYAIIDDDNDMLPEQMEFFVHTSHKEGFLYKDYCKLLKILNKE